MSTETKARAITLINGITWTDNWRNSEHTLQANSFIFPAGDFKKILEEPGVEFIRLYVGLQVKAEHGNNELVEKLVCVGADINQQDILPGTIAGEETSGIYDFSHPCPPLCLDLNSPLAGG